jgi:hypothetical protein
MSGVWNELWPYFLLILVGYLPNEIWRVLGLVLARGLDTIPLWVRVGAAVCGYLAFLAGKRSVVVGVAAGEAALLIGGFLFAS